MISDGEAVFVKVNPSEFLCTINTLLITKTMRRKSWLGAFSWCTTNYGENPAETKDSFFILVTWTCMVILLIVDQYFTTILKMSLKWRYHDCSNQYHLWHSLQCELLSCYHFPWKFYHFTRINHYSPVHS